MTQTQKKIFEWPLILALFWLLQAFELSLLQLPMGLGSIDILPPILIYLASTRSWIHLFSFAFIFSLLGSATAGYPATLYMASHLWMALVAKVVVQAFNLEGRLPFVLLCLGGGSFQRLLHWGLKRALDWPQDFALTFFHLLGNLPFAALVAYLFYPLGVWWDLFFEHENEEARAGLETEGLR